MVRKLLVVVCILFSISGGFLFGHTHGYDRGWVNGVNFGRESVYHLIAQNDFVAVRTMESIQREYYPHEVRRILTKEEAEKVMNDAIIFFNDVRQEFARNLK